MSNRFIIVNRHFQNQTAININKGEAVAQISTQKAFYWHKGKFVIFTK